MGTAHAWRVYTALKAVLTVKASWKPAATTPQALRISDGTVGTTTLIELCRVVKCSAEMLAPGGFVVHFVLRSRNEQLVPQYLPRCCRVEFVVRWFVPHSAFRQVPWQC